MNSILDPIFPCFLIISRGKECKGVFPLSFSYEILPCLRVVIISRRAEKSVKELVLGVFVSPHSFCNSFNYLSGIGCVQGLGLIRFIR